MVAIASRDVSIVAADPIPAPAPSRLMLPPAQRAAVGFAPVVISGVMLLLADALDAVVTTLVLFRTVLA